MNGKEWNYNLMKIVFFGTPAYVVPVVEALNNTFGSKQNRAGVVAVVTQKPKPVGRKQILEYSPVDTWAYKKGVPKFFNPSNILKNKINADVGVLASYGKIIPSEVINHFPYGIINIHFSLLPELRGAAPIPATLILGKKEAGVTIFKIDEILDHGPIISQFREEIHPEDTTGILMVRLFERSAEVLSTLIPAYLAGKITPREQDHDKATFARMIIKEDAYIPPEFLNAALEGESFKGKWKIDFIKDYSLIPSAYSLERFIRAMQPWPQAWTYVQLGQSAKDKEQRRLKILESHLESSPSTNSHLQSTKLVLDEVQLEGKTPVTWKQFKEGHPEATFS